MHDRWMFRGFGALVALCFSLGGAGSAGGQTVFSATGTAGVTASIAAFEAAIGGVNNGATATPFPSGFRVINWDAVGLGATDGAFVNQVITLNHTVGIPVNRFQGRGVIFEEIYAVTDTGFTTENPGLQPPVQFPAFSPAKTFAMFDENTIDLSFTLASAPGTPPAAAAVRGFGAVFLDVEHANSSSIEYFNGDTSLGKFFVPVGASTQPEFLGVLFTQPLITRVTLTLGEGVLFSVNGTTVTSGPPDLSIAGTVDQVATDDFVYSEPQPGFLSLAQVPTLDRRGLMALAALLAGLGFVVARRLRF